MHLIQRQQLYMNKNNPAYKAPVATTSETDGNETSVLEIAMHYLRYWKWFVVSVVLALLVAFAYVRYTTPVYRVTSTVLLKHERDRGSGWAGNLKGLGLMDMGGVSSVVNEIYVIGAMSSVREVVDRLNLHTTYMMKDGLKWADMYTNSPFVITMDANNLDTLRQAVEFTAKLTPQGGVYVVGEIGGRAIDTQLTSLPALLNTPQGTISIGLRPGVEPYYGLLHITIGAPAATVRRYRGNLGVEQADKISSIVNLSLKTPNARQGIDFLNTLVDVYNFKSIEDKNQEARNTRDFISERLAIIDVELSSAEGSVEVYKQQQGLTDLDVDLMQRMQQNSRYEQLLVQAETQFSVVQSLNDYVKNPANSDKPVPTNIGVKDATLSATSNEYNKLLAERERLSKSMAESNPTMVKMNEQIAALRQAINSSIASVMEGLAIERRNIANQVRIYSGKIGDVPRQERQFTEIAREQQIKARLYTILLQKREENALALAATSNNAIMLDSAYRAGVVHPRSRIIYLAALLIGLVLPVGAIYLLDMVRYKIRSRADVERLTKLPVLGDIPSYTNGIENNIVVSHNMNTEMDEAFRLLRTRLMLSLVPTDKVVVVTSTVPGEGKTFVAMNTAISLALLDKKVLLLGMDLRIPRLHEYMNISNGGGLSTYLSGYETDIEQLISPTSFSPNLYVMPAGPVPPNPAELLSRSSLDDAMVQLRKMFDYIIVDSAPISLVSDTLIINRIVDANMYICRANYSSKMNLKFANELMAKHELKNMLLVVNDVKEFNRGYGYGYGYVGKKKK